MARGVPYQKYLITESKLKIHCPNPDNYLAPVLNLLNTNQTKTMSIESLTCLGIALCCLGIALARFIHDSRSNVVRRGF